MGQQEKGLDGLVSGDRLRWSRTGLTYLCAVQVCATIVFIIVFVWFSIEEIVVHAGQAVLGALDLFANRAAVQVQESQDLNVDMVHPLKVYKSFVIIKALLVMVRVTIVLVRIIA